MSRNRLAEQKKKEKVKVKKIFEITYDGHEIQVENTWLNGERLYIDGQLYDENMGLALRATLTGRLESKGGESKNIKVAIGGIVKIHCKIFVENRLIYPEVE